MWTLISGRHGSTSPTRTPYGDLEDLIVFRIDATFVESHSNKDLCAGNFKGGYGFHPLTAWCDNTGECLAIIPRAGNAGSNTAARSYCDHRCHDRRDPEKSTATDC